MDDGGFSIPAVPYEQIDARNIYRQEVDEHLWRKARHRSSSIPAERFLYLILSNGSGRCAMALASAAKALPGRAGASSSGSRTWPRWKPPNEMVARQPHLEAIFDCQWRHGSRALRQSARRARALYIFKNGEDTLYRLHGTPEWQSIGKATSSGCVRLINQDVMDLYRRVRAKAPILVV